MMNKLFVFGDTPGVKQLLTYFPRTAIVGIGMASIRPHYFEELKSIAKNLDIPLLIQPRSSALDFEDFRRDLVALGADRALVNSYSMHLPASVLNIFPGGAFNIHSALLPKNRGPNPIQWALINGDKITGVTLHAVTSEFDQGGIVDQISVKISSHDNWLTLRDKLQYATESLLERNSDLLLRKKIASTPQDENAATKNSRRSEVDSFFNLSDRIQIIYRLHKAVLPPLPPATAVDCSGRQFALAQQLSLPHLAILIFGKRVRCLTMRLLGKTDRSVSY
jgi:UDP-4-amino-4-deoxy-L-arabinose formyltransferase/UDP-glucuronic acid dehydrogenase (UDP-4-keto-hexauronic acid decarboxylating)